MKLGPYILGPTDDPNQGIYTGDARELAPAIPDESVDLIFTDPIYQRIDDYRWLAETAARVLKQRGNLLVFTAHHQTISRGEILKRYLNECPVLIGGYQSSGGRPRLFKYALQVNSLPLLWFSKGAPKSKWQHILAESYILAGTRGHEWGKAIGIIGYRIEKFTDLEAIIFDPFTGGGTVPAVCKMLGRRWLAFEIVPATAETARQRVRQTQPPLFTLEPEQMSMEGI